MSRLVFSNLLGNRFSAIHRFSVASSYECIFAKRRFSAGINDSLPSHSRVVVCGGGTIGTSIAYHLSLKGFDDVVLLEQGSLSCGTSWHAAGLVSRIRQDNMATMAEYGAKLYKEMEENGYHTGYKECGSLIVTSNEERAKTIRRSTEILRSKGVICDVVLPAEIPSINPFVKSEDLVCGLHAPHDGTANPTDIINSFAKLAKENGTKIFENCQVEQILTENGRVSGVRTNNGVIKCQYVVLSAGMWSRQMAMNMDPPVNVPQHASEHFYLITKPIDDDRISTMLPVTRDYDCFTYVREWSGGFLVGLFEPNALPVFPDGVPSNLRFHLFPENWPHFEIHMQPMMERFPFLQTAEVQQLLNGPESFSPDSKPIIGEAPNVKNLFLATGMSSGGVVNAPGVGRLISEMICNQETFVDTSNMDIKRFHPHENNKMYLWDRLTEIVGSHYEMSYPKQTTFKTCHDARCSPLKPLHEQRGGVFHIINTAEVPVYYNPTNAPVKSPSISSPNWFNFVEEECQRCRKTGGLVDLTHAYSIFRIKDENASTTLDNLFYSELPTEKGQIVYSAMLNEYGKYVMDCHLLKEDCSSYIVVIPSSKYTMFRYWLDRNTETPIFSLQDLTHSYLILALLGPNSDEIFSSISDCTLRNGAFQQVNIGYGTNVLSYKPEDLPNDAITMMVPSQYSYTVYNTILNREDIKPIGVWSLDNMKITNGIPSVDTEITSRTSPLQVYPNSSASSTLKESYFIGKDALGKMKSTKPTKSMVRIKFLEDTRDDWLWGGEIIFDDRTESAVGSLTSTGYCFEENRQYALGFIDYSYLRPDSKSVSVKCADKVHGMSIVVDVKC